MKPSRIYKMIAAENEKHINMFEKLSKSGIINVEGELIQYNESEENN